MAALVHTCREAFPSLTVTNSLFPIYVDIAKVLWRRSTNFFRRLELACNPFCSVIHIHAWSLLNFVTYSEQQTCTSINCYFHSLHDLQLHPREAGTQITPGPSQLSTPHAFYRSVYLEFIVALCNGRSVPTHFQNPFSILFQYYHLFIFQKFCSWNTAKISVNLT